MDVRRTKRNNSRTPDPDKKYQLLIGATPSQNDYTSSPLKSHSLFPFSFFPFPLYLSPSLSLSHPTKELESKHLTLLESTSISHLATMQMLRFRSGSASKEKGSSPVAAGQSSPSASSTLLFSSSSSPSSLGRTSNGASAALGRPLRLVYCDGRGKFHLDPEAVAALQLVKGPVGVVSVCGRARQGKSFILNQLLGRSSGFQVASTHKPCTKGLWMWSAPIKRMSLDGTEYSLLLLDTEGIDAYDQTGTYSIQLFSLAVLLSSLFIYNQMGGIDEAALDRLSLVTEMTKHIRVRATGGKTSASEIGQFAPLFIWLLRDFYLDLAEENRKITPRDYLELALRPIQGGGRDVTSENEIRESIRALFPDRECFTLVRPLHNENDLQRLDQIPLERLRPEFRVGLDELTKFVFERTRPKQVGSTVMTGPMLAGLTQSFLDAINNGAVPVISSSWQSVEESECRRAYDTASEVYVSSFDHNKPAEEDALREAHEDAFQKSLASFNATAVGAGSARINYEKQLHKFCRKKFEDYKKSVFLEADKQCSDMIQRMDKKLRAACLAAGVRVASVIEVLETLLFEYESSCHGPGKWQMLAIFLRQCLEGPILDLCTKQINLAESERTALALKCRSDEDKLKLLSKQLEAQEKHKTEYLKRYEDAINDKLKISEDLAIRLSNLRSKYATLEERCTAISKDLDLARQESSNWRTKYEKSVQEHRAEGDKLISQIASLEARYSGAEGKYEAAREQATSAQEEALEWRHKYEVAAAQAKSALERVALVQDKINSMAQERVDSVRAEFADFLAEKEEEIKNLNIKLERAESHANAVSSQMQDAESQLRIHDAETNALKKEINDLLQKLDNVKSSSLSYEKEARILEQEKRYLEEKYLHECKKAEEAEEKYKSAERDAKRAIELANLARDDVITAQKEKSEAQHLSLERLTMLERVQRQVASLEQEKLKLYEGLQVLRHSEEEALSRVELLERKFDDREKEIEELMNGSNEQRSSSVHVFNDLLASERAARAEANRRAEALSLQLQITQGKLDALHQEMTTIRVTETALDGKFRSTSHGKRSRGDDVGTESVQNIEAVKGRGKSKLAGTSMFSLPEDGGSVYGGEGANIEIEEADSNDYTKFTVLRLRQELTSHGFGAQLLELKNPSKKDLLDLYEKNVLQK
ncbi:Guanylate-binding protein [Rhynchospora pubera]|uniref:Guanylate-binding protein n=1 Tax=Rhynchospora pubera TaxID=906938 RepID=A0AAV8DM13_9POAL|nr:Guanylate-binding protein [Rhynchospora pubera]